MPQVPTENNNRMSVRISSENKAILMRAATLEGTNLTDFITRTAVEAAKEVIEKSGKIYLSERDTLRVLNLLENPPEPNKRLMAAARAIRDKL